MKSPRFFDKFVMFCGNSKYLAFLIAANLLLSLSIMIVVAASHLFHYDTSWIYDAIALPTSLISVAYSPWTVVSYMFLQLKVIQLIFNLLWLFWFGPVMDDIASRRAIFCVYIGGGLFGAAAFLLVANITHLFNTPLTGGSAAVLAVMTAAAVLAPNRSMRFFLIGDIRLKWVAPLCILLAFLGNNNNPGGLAAHIGGVLFGLIYAFIPVLRRFIDNFQLPKPRRRKKPTTINITAFSDKYSANFSSNEAMQQRLNALLDKIRISGYNSLSDAERNELNFLSHNIDSNSSMR